MSEPAPRLRQVDAFPVEHEGQSCIALRDPAGYTDAVVLLPGVLLEIVSLFDGEHSIADIQAAVMRRHGELLPREQIQAVADSLDAQGFLESERFAARRGAGGGGGLPGAPRAPPPPAAARRPPGRPGPSPSARTPTSSSPSGPATPAWPTRSPSRARTMRAR